MLDVSKPCGLCHFSWFPDIWRFSKPISADVLSGISESGLSFEHEKLIRKKRSDVDVDFVMRDQDAFVFEDISER